MDSSLPIRTAESRDVNAVVALVNSAYRGDSSRLGWTTEADLLGGQRIDGPMLEVLLSSPDAALLVHESVRDIIACVTLEHGRDGCYLGMLTILPAAQAAGLGTRFLTAAEQFAQLRWHARSMYMTVIEQRQELIAWYERRGYVRTGETRPFPYGDPRFGLPKRADLRFVVLRKPLAD